MSSAFLAIQRWFVAAQQRGALLCLVSRNHEADVVAVLRARRMQMVLREEHVVAIRANDWQPKSEHVLELAATLCVSPDSIVFVDDNPAECAEVAAACSAAGVAVVRVPRAEASLEPFLEGCWALDTMSTCAEPTAEDAARTTLYRELEQRKAFLSSSLESSLERATSGAASHCATSVSMDAFVASLNLRVDVRPNPNL